MANSIRQEVDSLSETSITVYTLRGLDFVVPGEWQNTVSFDQMVREVSGETDLTRIRQIGEAAQTLYRNREAGYQQALWAYQTVDTADTALAAAAMANKIGQKVGFLSFLNRLTPKPDMTQTIDLGLKVVAELAAFSQINGIPRNTAAIGQFASALGDKYSGEALMRMVALVCIDGIVPLGPDFLRRASSILGGLNPSQLESNSMYKRISELIPGGSTSGQLSFINQSFESVQGWMNGLMVSRGLTSEKILSNLSSYIQFSDDKLDYLAAFLDMSTNYYSHTGTQSVARSLIQKSI